MLTGKGFFVWKVSAIYGGNVAQIAQEAKDAGLSHVIVKVADGRYRYNITNGRDLGAELIAQLKARGIQAWGWQYVYGANPVAEADLAIQLVNQFGLAGFVVNAEGQFKAKGMAGAADEYMSCLRKKLPKLPIALSTYRYPVSHPDFPFDAFLKHCDFAMPQVYWQGSSNPAEQLRKTISQFKSLKHIRPVLPTGSAYEFSGWSATPAQIKEFLGEARAQGLSAANFWEWGAALLKGGALWKAVQDYDWDGPSGPVVVPPNQPTYIRFKHDNQWMTDPKTGKRVRSRMELSDWNPGYHLDAYPAVVPLWTEPKGGDGAYKYSKTWAQFLRASNPVNFAELERVAAGLFNPRVNNQDPFPKDLSQYDGNTVAQGIGSTGNIYQVLEEKSGSVRVKLLDFQSAPPAAAALNYEDTPWLVNAFTAVTKDGSLKKTVGKDVVFPNLGRAGAGWVPKERVEFFPALPANLSVVSPVNIRKGPGLTYEIIGGYARGDSCVVTEYQPRGSNVWGKVGQDRWIALVYTNQAGSRYYTNWRMETNPPLALVNPRPYLEKPIAEQPAPVPQPEPIDLIERYFAALNKGDATKVAALYDKKNGKLVAEDRQFAGQKAIYNWYLRVFKNKLPGGKFKLTKVEKDGSFYEVSWTATARKAAVADGRDLIRVQDSGPELITYHYTQFSVVKI